MKKAGFLALVMFVAFLLCGAGPVPASENPVPGMETFDEVFNYVQEIHISRPDSGILVEGAIRGLIESLDDPYTEYLPPEQLKEFNGFLDGEYVGVGLQLEPGEVYPAVVDAITNTPASRAGIKPGDLVVKVDGADIAQEPLGRVVQQIRGPEGSTVRLTIRRAGTGDFEVELARANINIPTVSAELLSDGIGYLSIDTFGSSTAAEFEEALVGLIRRGAGKFIIDLRQNPGGMLQAAVDVAENFLDRDLVVVSTVDREGNRYAYRAEGRPVARGLPVVVLVDYNSASAAEILAGALHEHGAANLIGGRTFGKGTVQILIPLKAGGALKITSARYHTPWDRVIEGYGLAPDLQVLTPELQVPVAHRFLKRAERYTLVFNPEKSEARVNGLAVPLRRSVVYRNDDTYLPLRFVFEALGYRVDWQPEDGSIKAAGHMAEMVFYPSEGRALAGGRELSLERPLLVEGGAAYLPLTSLANFNIRVTQEGGMISIEK